MIATLAMEKRIQQSERLCEEVENENHGLNERIHRLEQVYEKTKDMRKVLKKEQKKRKKQKKQYDEMQLALFLYMTISYDGKRR
jgi:uncharacterized protein YecA (UPF0149 family)